MYLESFEELFGDGDSVCRRDEVTSSDSLASVLHHSLNHLTNQQGPDSGLDTVRPHGTECDLLSAVPETLISDVSHQKLILDQSIREIRWKPG